jgi:glucose/arabinose dehydrogenase
MDRKSSFATLASLSLLLSACGGGDKASDPPVAEPAEIDTTAPTIPSNVTAAAKSSTEIDVAWNASTDASGISAYRVFRDGGATAVGTVTATAFTDSGLTPATSYSYTVVAVDGATAANVSQASPAASATTNAATPPPVKLAVQRVYPLLKLTAAHTMLRVPHDASRWVVVQQDGHAVSFEDKPDVSTTSNVLDITDRIAYRNVHGLLGLVFHPDYPTDARAWAAYTHDSASGVVMLRVSEFSSVDGGKTLNPASEQILFEMPQPGGHNNGGNLVFGPDGMLYFGSGDGGSDDANSDAEGNGQLTNTLLGKMLRLDVSGSANGRRYRIPADNPFASNPMCNTDGSGTKDCPEIFAWGFRNPWRWSFDRVSGQLWVGDVGAHAREEIDKVVKGGNYGWRCIEGTKATNITCGTPTTPLIAPVAEYAHPDGLAVTGGFVYRGTAIPGLVGRYVFADYSTGYIWHIATDTAPTRMVTLADGWNSTKNPASFAEDTNGELFLVDVRSSQIWKLVAAP